MIISLTACKYNVEENTLSLDSIPETDVETTIIFDDYEPNQTESTAEIQQGGENATESTTVQSTPESTESETTETEPSVQPTDPPPTEPVPTDPPPTEPVPTDPPPTEPVPTDPPPTEPAPTEPNPLLFDLSRDVRFFGRTYTEEGIHYFNWSASGFSIRFKGSGVTAEFVTSKVKLPHRPYIKVYVDGVEMDDVLLNNTHETVVLAKDLDPNQEHIVCIMKRTNAESSAAGVMEIRLADGEILPPEKDKQRLIEFVGDSLTVGYVASLRGTAATTWSTATEDVTGTYCKQIADAFNADHNVIAISGKGIVRNNGGDTDALLPEIYQHLDYYNKPGVMYDFQRQADVIIINLGTNDEASANKDLSPDVFMSGLRKFLLEIREKNPQAYIVYTYGLTRNGLMDEIEDVINEMRGEGDERIYLVKLELCSSEERNLNHPKRTAYISRGAMIIQKIKEITGWETV